MDASATELLDRLRSLNEEDRIDAAREIRWLTKASSKNRRLLACAVDPLVLMLRSGSLEGTRSAMLALLNLAVKDERNKINIVGAGALIPLCGFLQSPDSALQEHAAASLLTLSASSMNKTIICSAGAIPPLIVVLAEGSPQAKIDAAAALFNLSTTADNFGALLSSHSITPLVTLLQSIDKSSKTAEKCCALLESLLSFDDPRSAAALASAKGGVLAVVEVLEDGSVVGRERAVGALLTMCKGDRKRYREAILNEGVIPGLLELTVQGTPSAQSKARELLRLLRESPYPRPDVEAGVLQNVVCSIVSRIDGCNDGMGAAVAAKKMLAEMVQVSMEHSMMHLQQRAFDVSLGSCCSMK